jgi:hypothetical protein
MVYINKDDWNSEARAPWEEFVNNMKSKNVEVVDDYYKVAPDRRVRVIHSGVASTLFENGYLSEGLSKGYRYLVFETDDAPTSKLLQKTGIPTYRMGQGLQNGACSSLQAKYQAGQASR